jgi:hypothetical protein
MVHMSGTIRAVTRLTRTSAIAAWTRRGSRFRGPGARSATWALAACVALLVLAGAPADAAPTSALPRVGVVDFYAVTPVATYNGLVPEAYAADRLSQALARDGAGRLTVIPRPAMRQAERAIGWHGPDILKFARLSELARQAGADRLVVGQIRMLFVNSEGSHEGVPGGGGGEGMKTGLAVLVVQVFDASQGRIVAETRQAAQGLGPIDYLVVEDQLDSAVAHAVPPLLPALETPVP